MIPSTYRVIEWVSKAIGRFGRAIQEANIDLLKMLKSYGDREETLSWD